MALLSSKYKAVTVVLAFLIASCSPEPVYLDPYISDGGSIDLSNNLLSLVSLPEAIVNAFVLNDSSLVTFRDYKNGQDVLNVRLLEEEKDEGVLVYGSDKGELMSALPSRHKGMVLLHDFVKDEVHVVDLSNPKKLKISPLYSTNVNSQMIAPVTMNRGVFLNASSKKKRRIIATDSDYRYPGRVPKSDMINVSHGTIVMNEEIGRCALLDRIYSRIEIFDGHGRKMHVLRTRNLEDQQYDTDKEGRSVFLNSICQSFIDGCEYDNGFAALYRPGIISPQSGNQSPLTYILMLDWSGQIVKSFHISSSVQNVSLSRDGSRLYLFEEGAEGKRLATYEI